MIFNNIKSRNIITGIYMMIVTEDIINHYIADPATLMTMKWLFWILWPLNVSQMKWIGL